MSRKRNLSAVSTIPQAVEEVKSQAEEISPSQLAHLQKVYAEVDHADKNLHEAIANQQACAGARNSFMAFLTAEYVLAKGDEIDLKTGKITHKS
jgi:hypothetical protein